MRVISGIYKSRKIKQVPLLSTRETSDKIRGACFNMLGNISNLNVLDLFAGSGAYGIESLSRGAQSVTFVDINKTAIKTIYENLKSLNINNNYYIHNKEAIKYLKENMQIFDVIFLDPPYDYDINNVLILIKNNITENSIIIYEHQNKFTINDINYTVEKNKTYGNKVITILKYKKK